MDANLVDTALLQVRERLEHDDVPGALRLIAALYPADRADVFEELPLEQQQTLLPHLENEDAADILEELEDEEAAALAGSIDAYHLAPILDRDGAGRSRRPAGRPGAVAE